MNIRYKFLFSALILFPALLNASVAAINVNSLQSEQKTVELLTKTIRPVIKIELEKLKKINPLNRDASGYRHLMALYHAIDEAIQKNKSLALAMEQYNSNQELYPAVFSSFLEEMTAFHKELQLIPYDEDLGIKPTGISPKEKYSYNCDDALENISTFDCQREKETLPCLGTLARETVFFLDGQKLITKTLQHEHPRIFDNLKSAAQETPALHLCANYLIDKKQSQEAVKMAVNNWFMLQCIDKISNALQRENYADIPSRIIRPLTEHRKVLVEAYTKALKKRFANISTLYNKTIANTSKNLDTGHSCKRLQFLDECVTRELGYVKIPQNFNGSREERIAFKKEFVDMIENIFGPSEHLFDEHINKERDWDTLSSKEKDKAILCPIITKEDQRKLSANMEVLAIRNTFGLMLIQRFGPILEQLHKFEPSKLDNHFFSEHLDPVFWQTKIIDSMKSFCFATMRQCLTENKLSLQGGLVQIQKQLKSSIASAENPKLLPTPFFQSFTKHQLHTAADEASETLINLIKVNETGCSIKQ